MITRIVGILFTVLLSATVAFATNTIVAGETFVGTCPTDKGEVIWVKQAPEGLILGDDGLITWQVPVDTPTGTYSFTCKIKEKGSNSKYMFPIDVVGVTTTAEAVIGVAGGDVVAENVKLTIPNDIVPDGTTVSIGSLNGDAPNLPAGVTLYGEPFVLGPHNVFVPEFPAEMPDFESAIDMNNFLLNLETLQESNVSLTIENLPTNQLFLITYLPGTKTWRFVENSVITEEFDGTFTLTAYLNHFSVYGIIYDETSTSGSNWIQYMPYVDAIDRITALQEAYAYAEAASTDTYVNYVFNTLNPFGQKDKQLWPRGESSSETSAQALADEMAASPWVTDYFEVSVVNSGYIIADRSLPVPYYQVKMTPLMDDGTPSFLVDRYHGAKIHRITATYGNDEDGEKHYAVETYDDPHADFFVMENDIQPDVPKVYCTLDQNHPEPWNAGPSMWCDMHRWPAIGDDVIGARKTGLHCTIGNPHMECPIHRYWH
jgi:hypothetical protein